MSYEVELYDVTLRDGAQTEGVSFSIKDKISICKLLDDFGISYIEGGWPGSNPKDTEFFQLMKREKLNRASLIAFGSTRRASNKPEDDHVLKALIEAETKHINIFAKGWDFHVKEALKISLEENLDLVFDSVQYLKKYAPRVTLGIEHFFDGFKANPQYVAKLMKAAQDGGAYWIGVADTNGGCMPWEIEEILTKARAICPLLRVIHLHQDTGLAIANTIKAIQCGVNVIHGTFNGIGERCGMVDFCTLIPNLKLKLGINCVSDEQLKRLREIALYIAKCGGFKVPKFSPYVGEYAFYHKDLQHIDSVIENSKTYNHIEPELVGNESRTSVIELVTRENILLLASKHGIEIDAADPKVDSLLEFIQEQESSGFQNDVAVPTEFLLFREFLTNYQRKIIINEFDFNMVRADSTTDLNAFDERVVSDVNATIEVTIDNKQEKINVSHKQGPLAALSKALREALNKHFNNLGETLKVNDLKINILDCLDDDQPLKRVKLLLGFRDLETNESFYCMSISTDIYSAFLKGLIDAYEYKLIKKEGE